MDLTSTLVMEANAPSLSKVEFIISDKFYKKSNLTLNTFSHCTKTTSILWS